MSTHSMEQSFRHGGEAGALMDRFDWSTSSVGVPDAWPQQLQTLVSIVLGSIQPMFVVWGPDGALIYNDAYSEILAAKHPAAMGRPFLEVWSEIKSDLIPIVQRAYAGQPVHMADIELHMLRRGYLEEAHFAFSYTPIRDTEGLVAGFFCACTETTAQVLSDRKEAELIARQRRLFQQAPGFITILREPDHVFEFVNDAYVKLFGDRSYIGKTVREAFPDLIGQDFFDWLDRVYATGERYIASGVSARFRLHPDHPETERTLDFIYEPVLDEAGRVTGIFCEGHDVTEIRTAQLALEENDRRLRELNVTLESRVAEALAERRVLAEVFDTTDAFIQVADLDYRWLAINQASAAEFERIFGVRPSAGMSMLEILADRPDEQAAVKAVWARALAGEGFTLIDEFGDHERDRRYYEMKFNVLRDAEGQTIGAYQFVYDVTERLTRESELLHAREALRQSQKMDAMGQLTGGVAHDFNNLLTPIIGSLDMIQRRGLGDARAHRMIDGALQSAERAKTLVQRLLAFARRQPLQPQPVDVSTLVRGIEELLATTLGPRVRTVLDVPADLPPAVADHNQLEMALLNLAVNARDAMPDGGTLTIALSGDAVPSGNPDGLKPGTYLRLCVTDTGTGMDEETLMQATEPFFSTKGVGRGTGLGLSMVHGLAAQLGGALRIQSTVGTGTTIKVWLPVSAGEAGVPKDSLPPSTARGSGLVLLVDDEALVRATTADMLTDLNYQVIEAASAHEALRLLEQQPGIDAIVSDHLMPVMTGTELAHEARQRRPDLAVLLISGYADAEGVDPNLARLTKPFRQSELAAKLSELVRKPEGAPT
ncbi:PAS domain-containing protein [Brevundimonas sp. GCM10030266]|uniref:PAS domain-containing protein n=1 Tax=Brevundimonas sp. GCM10030266 TaxID=3273386 RepID=UPI003613408B